MFINVPDFPLGNKGLHYRHHDKSKYLFKVHVWLNENMHVDLFWNHRLKIKQHDTGWWMSTCKRDNWSGYKSIQPPVTRLGSMHICLPAWISLPPSCVRTSHSRDRVRINCLCMGLMLSNSFANHRCPLYYNLSFWLSLIITSTA